MVNDVEREGLLVSGAPRTGNRAAQDVVPQPFAPADWVLALSSSGAEQQVALRELHALMVRAAAHQVWRMRGVLPDASPGTVDVIVNQSADEAMAALLRKLHTFEGRSAFTTWAFKFAILQAASDVRRLQWQHREVELRDLDVEHVSAVVRNGPERQAEGSDLAHALAESMRSCLTPHQRRVAVALLVDGVPIDVLAQRLGTNRNALYKTLHDVRQRLRTDLIRRGYLPGGAAQTTPDHPPTAPTAPTASAGSS